ncbi:MAG: BACON domain-containing protein [Vicinamibacterales bacterium]
MINGQRAQVAQAAGECHFELSSNATALPQSGGTGRVDVRASSALCTWTAVSDVDWITVNSNANGKGSATVTFTVAPTTGPPRAGTLTIAGQHFSVTQSEGCTYAVAPTTLSVDAAGGTRAVAITAGAGCPWTASSNADWISVGSASGSGPASVTVTVAPTTGPSRTGTVTIAGQVLTITQAPGCTFDVSPLSFDVDAAGGMRTINVTAASGCAWAASSNQPWITIASSPNGNGSGAVTVSVAADNGPSRSGTVIVAERTVTIRQGNGCTFAISPDSQSVAAAGGTGSVTVTAGAGCAWTAASAQSWITITSGSGGSGNGTVNFTVASTNGPGRSGAITIAGHTFTINQGQGCTFALSSSSTSAPAAGASGTFDVKTGDGCAWAANTNVDWISVTSGTTGSGNGTVRYTVAANSGPQRSGTITAGGQTFTVMQGAGCTYAISPMSQNAGTGGGTQSVAVTAPAGCAWNATSNAGWIGISSGSSGSGNGTVQLVIAPNPDAERHGTVTIAGQTYTVVQSSGCTFSLSPASQAVPAGGGPGSFTVNTNASCAWTAAANAGWISITSGGSGTGPGTVQFTAAPNGGAARSGTITTTGGQTFTVTQDSGCSAVVTPDTIPAPAAGGSQTVSISTAADCTWSAGSNASWIAIGMPAGGSGNGTVRLDIQPNADAARSGTATVAGKTVTVNQDSGCTITISPSSTPMVVGGGSGSVTVTAGAGCSWTAAPASGTTWIAITGPSGGTGPGTVTFTVDANATGIARSGSITIGTQVFTVNQAGS